MVGEGRKGCDLERSVQGLEEDGLETATVSSSHLALSPLILGLPPEPPIGEEYRRTTDASTRRRGGGRGAQSKRQGKIYSKGTEAVTSRELFYAKRSTNHLQLGNLARVAHKGESEWASCTFKRCFPRSFEESGRRPPSSSTNEP